MRGWIGTGVVLLAAAAAAGQSITTNFSGPSESLSNRNAGVFFDITAQAAGGITVQGFDVNSDAPAGQGVRVEVYYSRLSGNPIQGQYSWVMLGVEEGPSAGPGQPTPVAVGGLHLPQGVRTGFYIVHSSGGVRFNTAAATTTPVSNADVRLDMGGALELLFGGPVRSPRGWMGTVHYQTGNHSTVGACCLPIGSCAETTLDGCAASGGVWRGLQTNCSSTSCAQPMSCCLSDGCVMLFGPKCAAVGGTPGPSPYSCQPGMCGALHTSGYTVTQAGGGFGGANLSRASGDASVLGKRVSAEPGGPDCRVAQEFGAWNFPGWNLSNVSVYGLIAAPAGAPYGFPPQSPVTGASVRIWNGPPGTAGAAVVASREAMAGTAWTGAYRVLNEQDPLEAAAPIMSATVDFSGVYLPRGRYWLDYQLTGSQGGSGVVFSPLAMTPMWHPEVSQDWWPTRRLAGAGWELDGQDVPFVVRGTVAPVVCYANCDGSTALPVLNVNDFICFQVNYAAGDPYANCDGSTGHPVLNVNDFLCFQQRYGAGCP